MLITDKALISPVACLALRVYTRGYIVRIMGMEDWTMMAAAVSKTRRLHTTN